MDTHCLLRAFADPAVCAFPARIRFTLVEIAIVLVIAGCW